MENPRDDLASVLEQITARLEKLESRVSSLEQHPQPVRLPAPSPTLTQAPALAALSPVRAPGAGTAIGKLFLGIAGGYLLRALAESGALSQLATVLLALLYAAAWLVWAARMSSEARFASTASAATAALIFSPMLWEVTLRFKVFPNTTSAAVLAAFVALASALAWKRSLISVAWVASFFPAVVALMLLVASRDPAPFAAALLAMAALTEYAGTHDRWPSLRSVMALLADSAVLLLIILYLGPNPLPPDYIPIRPAVLLILALALFAIYGISIAFSTLLLRRSISIFEIAQAIIAFALATISILRTNQGAATIIGAFCLLLAGACYLAALARFDHISQTRNYHVFACWAAALTLIGSFLTFPATIAGLFFSAAAILGTFFGVRSSRWTLAFHGALYLAMAGYFSGLWGYSASALAGPLASPSGWGLWTTVFSALLCCAVIWWERECSAQRIRSLLRLIFSSSATYAATALALAGVVWIISSSLAAGTPVLAVVRTLVLCLVIVGLSFSGAKWHRAELIWIAYAAIAFCTLKLLFEDLRYGTTASLATSLFFYGTIWVLVPRLVRSGAR